MADLYEKGRLRLQPASFFAQKDHNGAVRDDELSLDVMLVLSRDDVVKVVRIEKDVPADAPDQRFDVRFKSPTDYWLYCVTTSVEPRLFVDFQASACVIIRDHRKFVDLLRDAAMKSLPLTKMHMVRRLMSIRFYRRHLKFLPRLPNTSAIHTKRSIASVGSRPHLRCNFPMWMLKSAGSAVLNGWASRGCLSQSGLPLVLSARPGRQRAGSFHFWPAAAVRAETHRVRPLGCCERFFRLYSLCRPSHEGMG
jgi:hypothetical protein